MTSLKTYYRAQLPHYLPIGATFFVTFRLAGSLPETVIYQLKDKFNLIYSDPDSFSMDREKIKNQMSQYFSEIDGYLDQNNLGDIRLDNKSVADVISQKLHEYNSVYYNLMAYTIMPNHVHVLFDFSCQVTDEDGLTQTIPTVKYKQLDQVMQLIKGGSSFEINKILGRNGPVWARESYDRVVRDHEEKGNVICYILDNPVKAGFVGSWEDWPYSYLYDNSVVKG